MCKNWIEVGLCRYGNKCQFAHGEHELMGKAPPINNNKYKSKTCTTFTERLFCPYGQRCLFKHEDRNFDEVKYLHYVYKILIAKEEDYLNCSSQSCKRLKVFANLTKQFPNQMIPSPFKSLGHQTSMII
jgi:Zinc finger domain